LEYQIEAAEKVKAMTAHGKIPTPQTPPGGVRRHGAGIYDEAPHDPYQAKGKYAEPCRCGDCGLIFHNGRWVRGDSPHEARSVRCPACHRIHDKIPAGYIVLEGPFVDAHRGELLALMRHEETQESADHPLHRIMSVEEEPGRVTVTTTDIHTARRIGEAARHAWHGELELNYGRNEYSLRATWRG
jgi:hypothetical protein